MIEISQAAFVLHSRPYRENQVIVDFLTEQDGKVAALSYVGHSGKSSRKALLQPFLPVDIVLKGNQALKHLVRIEARNKSLALRSNHLYSGFYINELIVKLLGENIHCGELFNHYHQSLNALAKQDSIETTLRRFELSLLEELGVSFDFSVVFEHPLDGFYYQPEQGFVGVTSVATQSCYPSEHLRAIAEQDFSTPEVLRTFKLLMRQVINHLLGGVALNSRKLFKKN